MECLTPIHYAPVGVTPLCGEESSDIEVAVLPEMVTRYDVCLELVAEGLADHSQYQGRCLHCREAITAQGGVQWRRVVRHPCPHCGQRGW